jgi:hypothetical protein
VTLDYGVVGLEELGAKRLVGEQGPRPGRIVLWLRQAQLSRGPLLVRADLTNLVKWRSSASAQAENLAGERRAALAIARALRPIGGQQ